MVQRPTLMFLHGVSTGDPDPSWRAVLDESLKKAGYRGLDGIHVISPSYSYALKGTDDKGRIPPVTLTKLRGMQAVEHDWKFERSIAEFEEILGPNEPGDPTFHHIVPTVAVSAPKFVQAKNYLRDSRIAAAVLKRILRRVPDTGHLVIVAHSLGSVIAAELIPRLPRGITSVKLVTIGSPLANDKFYTRDIRKDLRDIPANLDWWVNFWGINDPVCGRGGISKHFPWMLDHAIRGGLAPDVHSAATYLRSDPVAQTVGRGLFGSLSTELVVSERDLELHPNQTEQYLLTRFRLGHLIMSGLEGEKRTRYAYALAQSQETTMRLLLAQAEEEGRRPASAIARLYNEQVNANGHPVEVGPAPFGNRSDSASALVMLATQDLVSPYEIEIPIKTKRTALSELTAEMGLKLRFGENVVDSISEAMKVLAPTGSWKKWAAIGVGTAAILATGGLALFAVPTGLAGAAAITAGLAAFGPGGMVGGLATAGALTTIGTAGIATGLASPSVTAETLQSVIVVPFASAILRGKEELDQDPEVRNIFMITERELLWELRRLRPLSDKDAPSIKDLENKIRLVQRALKYLEDNKLLPDPEVEEFPLITGASRQEPVFF